MIEFIGMVIASQPLILVALGCVLLSAFITLFWGRDFQAPRILYLFPNNTVDKWPHWVCGFLLTAATVIWVILTFVNHTNIQNDILSFLTVMGFSVLLIYVAQIIYLVLMVLFVTIVVGVWFLINKYIIRD